MAAKKTPFIRKYAQALFAQAKAKDQVLACAQGLQELSRISQSEPKFRGLLLHPSLSLDEKVKIVTSVLKDNKTPLLTNFLTLLLARDRFAYLSQIVEAFQVEVDQSQNAQPVSVQTAAALSDSEKTELTKKLEALLKTSVRLETQVDEQLLAGVVVRTRDYKLDWSLKGKLEELKKAIV